MTSESFRCSAEPGCLTEASTTPLPPSGSTPEPSSIATSTPAAKRSSRRAAKTAGSKTPRSGPTFAHSRVISSEAELTQWLEASLARTCQTPGSEPDSLTSLVIALDRAYSTASLNLQPTAERDSCSWRMSGGLFPQPALFRRMRTKTPGSTKEPRNAPSVWSSEPFPMPALVLQSCLFVLPTLGRPTADCEFSSWDGDGPNWPTPVDADSSRGTEYYPGGNATLIGSVNAMSESPKATPTGSGNHNTKGASPTSGAGLATQVASMASAGLARPTPRASDHKSSSHEGVLQEVMARHWTPSLPEAVAGTQCKASARPTPTGDDANNGTRESGAFKSLSRDVQAWATPTASAGPGAGNGGREGGENLQTMVASAAALGVAWATPKARDFRSGCTDQVSIDHLMDRRVEGSNDLTNQVTANTKERPTGTLNPEWVECLMGWEMGWTDASQPCTRKWVGWPAGMGPYQFDYEPPRIAPRGSVPNRVARIKACGNGVVRLQAESAFGILLGVIR